MSGNPEKISIKVGDSASSKLVSSIIKLVQLRYGKNLGVEDAGRNYKIRCPFHEEDTASMFIHKELPLAKCFGCGVYFTNPAAVLQKARIKRFITEVTFWEIVHDLDLNDECLEAGGVKIYHATELKFLEFFKELTDLFTLTFAEHLSKQNKSYLENDRKLDITFLERTKLIGQVPPTGEIVELYDDMKLPKNNKQETIEQFGKYVGKLVFPIQMVTGEVVGFLFRGIAKESMGQIYLSTLYDKSVFPAGGFIGIASLSNANMSLLTEEGISSAIMVEGPYDMLQTLSMVQYANVPRLPLAYKQVTGKAQVAELQSIGINSLYYIPDNDPNKYGDLSVGIKNILSSFPMTMTGFILSLEVIRSWDCRDIDDLVKKAAGSPSKLDIIVEKLFLSNNKFLTIDQFLVEEIYTQESLSIPVIEELSKKLIKLLENPTYVIKAIESLNRPELKTMTEALNMCVKDHIDDILSEQMLELLNKKYTFIFKEVDTKSSHTFVYCVYNGHVHEILLESKGIETFLINLEGDIIEWFERNFSQRDILRISDKQKITSDFVMKRIIELCKRAFTKIVVTLPHKSQFQLKTHGIHKLEGSTSMLLVNGNTYMKFSYPENKKSPDIEIINIPIVGNFIIETEKCRHLLEHKLKEISEFEPIKFEGYTQLYKKVQKIIKCWSWGGLHFEALLAGYLCTVWVQIMFPYTMSPFFTADRSSGKTKFLSLLSGMQGVPPLLPGSMCITDASAAGLRSIVGSSTIPIFLDEFEPRNKNFEQLLAFLRSLTTGGGKTIRGTQKGEYLEYAYKTPIGLAAINTLQGDADNSRFTYIPLQHEQNHSDPLDKLRSIFSDNELIAISYDLIRYPLKFLPKLKEAYEIMKDIISSFRENHNIPTRTSMNMCLPLAMVGLIEGYEKATSYFSNYIHDQKIKAFSQFNDVGKEIDTILEYLVSTEFLYENSQTIQSQARSLYYMLQHQVALSKIEAVNNSVCVFKIDNKVYAAIRWAMFKAWLNKIHFKTAHVVTLDTMFLNASLDKRIDKEFIENSMKNISHFGEFYRKYLSSAVSYSVVDITNKVSGFIKTISNDGKLIDGVEPGILD